MRKKLEVPEQYRGAFFRLERRFLWTRTILQNEERWLEFAYIVQHDVNAPKRAGPYIFWWANWKDVAWVD